MITSHRFPVEQCNGSRNEQILPNFSSSVRKIKCYDNRLPLTFITGCLLRQNLRGLCAMSAMFSSRIFHVALDFSRNVVPSLLASP